MVRLVKNDLAGRLRTQSVNEAVMQSGIFHSLHGLDCIIMSIFFAQCPWISGFLCAWAWEAPGNKYQDGCCPTSSCPQKEEIEATQNKWPFASREKKAAYIK